MELFPADDLDIDYELKALENRGFILRYSVNEKNYIQVTNFTKHQNPHHKEVASVFPPPNGYPVITKEIYDVSNELREAIFLRDGYKCLCCGATENLQIDHIKHYCQLNFLISLQVDPMFWGIVRPRNIALLYCIKF